MAIDARSLRRSRRAVGPEKAQELVEIQNIENYVNGDALNVTLTSEQVEDLDSSDNEEVENAAEETFTAKQLEEIELARRVIELIKIIAKFEVEKENIYKKNEYGIHHPALSEIEELDSVPICPTTCVELERTEGRTGPTPKTKPICSYCYITLKSKYEEYDHLLKHLQMYKFDCPFEDCDKCYGTLESTRCHLNRKHKKNMSVMETEEPELWKKTRKPSPCTEDQPYHCES